eukprot:3400205-Amphidinium_carterae.1
MCERACELNKAVEREQHVNGAWLEFTSICSVSQQTVYDRAPTASTGQSGSLSNIGTIFLAADAKPVGCIWVGHIIWPRMCQ